MNVGWLRFAHCSIYMSNNGPLYEKIYLYGRTLKRDHMPHTNGGQTLTTRASLLLHNARAA
jgi:hypothetical protein